MEWEEWFFTRPFYIMSVPEEGIKKLRLYSLQYNLNFGVEKRKAYDSFGLMIFILNSKAGENQQRCKWFKI